MDSIYSYMLANKAEKLKKEIFTMANLSAKYVKCGEKKWSQKFTEALSIAKHVVRITRRKKILLRLSLNVAIAIILAINAMKSTQVTASNAGHVTSLPNMPSFVAAVTKS